MIEAAPAKFDLAPIRPVTEVTEIPEAFQIALADVDLDLTTRPALPEIPTETLIPTVERGRDRFIPRLVSSITDKIKGIGEILKYIYKGRGGRGPCPGCISGGEGNHHFGSKCSRRGIGSSLKSKGTSNFSISSLAFKPSGFNQFYLKR